ncbi:MAG: flavin reductase [Clostridia bacterium]|nr:flavin reductase [Clostridia bacterium]
MRLTEAKFNFAERVAKSALLTVAKPSGEMNTMTVSWGGSGILWGKEVCFVFVRPERYTFEFCESGRVMSLSFFGEERHQTLSYCGTKSGREVDKFKECDLKYTMENGACIFDDAQLTIVMEKMYEQELSPDSFVSDAPKSFYTSGGYHKMYICEIKDIISR